MIKPEKLKKGDKVAIVSLSSGILGETSLKFQLELGIKRLHEFGLNPVFMPNALKGTSYILNHPDDRAKDLKYAFEDDSIKGIICAIGGDDTYRTIPYLMEDEGFRNLVVTKPKVFIGFSDSTNNHIMLNRLGLVTYYGLNFLSDLCELQTEMLSYTRESYQRLLKNDETYEIISSPYWYLNRTSYRENQLGTKLIEMPETKGHDFLFGSGKTSGIFWGGCLESIYDAYTSERYKDQRRIYDEYNLIPNKDFFKDKILFIETSEEMPKPKDFNKMIDFFVNEGIFQNINCLLVGKPYDEVFYNEYRDKLMEVAKQLNMPTVYNINFGHALPRTMIPYGLKGEVDFASKKILVIEKLFL